MKKIINSILVWLLAGCSCFAATEYGKTVFMDDVSVGTWNATSNLTWNTDGSATGTWTAGPYTNYYRVGATNLLGGIPTSTNIVVEFTGNTNTGILATNQINITWEYIEGAKRVIIERSLDEGATWTNWVEVLPYNTNYVDYGTNTWTETAYSSNAIPAISVPWSGGAVGSPIDSRAATSTVDMAENPIVDAESITVGNSTGAGYLKKVSTTLMIGATGTLTTVALFSHDLLDGTTEEKNQMSGIILRTDDDLEFYVSTNGVRNFLWRAGAVEQNPVMTLNGLTGDLLVYGQYANNGVQALGNLPSAATINVSNNYMTAAVTGATTVITLSGTKDGASYGLWLDCTAGYTNVTISGATQYENYYLEAGETNKITIDDIGGLYYGAISTQ